MPDKTFASNVKLPLQAAPVDRRISASAINGGVEPNFLPLLLGLASAIL